jgi:hypothetical protein
MRLTQLRFNTKTRLLLLLVTTLAVALASALTPPPAQAIICPEGSTLEVGIVYWTDAAHTAVFCTIEPCGGNDCNGRTTPYHSVLRDCC